LPEAEQDYLESVKEETDAKESLEEG